MSERYQGEGCPNGETVREELTALGYLTSFTTPDPIVGRHEMGVSMDEGDVVGYLNDQYAGP